MRRRKIIIAFIASVLFSVVFSVLFKWGQTGNPFSPETIMYGSVVFVNILLLGAIARVLMNRFSGISSARLRTRIIPAFLLFVLIALVISLLLVSLGVYLFFLIQGLDTSGFVSRLFEVELRGAIRQFSIWILIGSAFFFYIIWRGAVEREQKLREENLKYQYRTLKAQVNPHFLFNSLNTLSELVYEDAEKADRYTQKLSGIYRYILENDNKDLVPLEEEIEFVNNYFSLQEERDKGKISLEIDIHNTGGLKIIPVSLQLLVENALKHNVASKENPLGIRIYLEEDCAVVSNMINKKNLLESHTRTGLSNLGERVRLILGKELVVREESNQFIVKIPVTPA